jgi:crotonobetainyl-CoA:carnitine CoA-transferase CaiB-like acyl-CoA transferase
MERPLEGIFVVELSTMITASFAAMMMAEQGARVVKVEPLEAGDPMRYLGTSKGGMSGLFANCNRGKRSIRVNLKDPAGQSIVRDLAARADILIHNFRPGVMDGLALGSDALRAANSKLIYIAISGFGREGPMRDAPAYDPIVQARAGFAAVQGSDAPVFVRNLVCDKITAYTACQAATAALLVRTRTGVGQHIDLSMLDASLFFLFPDGFMNHTLLDADATAQPLLADVLYGLTATKDGSIAISAGAPSQRVGALRAIGREDLLTDPRFSSLPALMANLGEYQAILASAFAAFTTDELLEKLEANDVPCSKCFSRDEVIADPQLAANGTLGVSEHPLVGRMRLVRYPTRFEGERLPPAAPSPDHGEHTMSVLAELGLPADRVAALRSTGVVR